MDLSQGRLDHRVSNGLAMGVDVVEEALSLGGILGGFRQEQSIVESDFGTVARRGADPVNGPFDLALGSRSRAALGLWVVSTKQLDNIASRILDDLFTLDDVGVAQTDFSTWLEPKELRGWSFHKVLSFNKEGFGKRDFSIARRRVFRVVDRLEFFDLAFWIVRQCDFDWVEDCHVSGSCFIEMLADGIFQNQNVDHTVETSHSDRLTKIAERLRSVSSTSISADGRHAWIVPSIDMLFGHELKQLALAHDRVA